MYEIHRILAQDNHSSKQRIASEPNTRTFWTDHFICLHCKLHFVITELFAFAVGILDLLQMLHSLF